MGLAFPHTICLREDGSSEIEELLGFSLREPDDTAGGGDDGSSSSISISRRFQHNWAKEFTRMAEIHNAAVRLGRKGGIASGIARR